ncbi:hypothetical protein ABZ392_28045, partial [Streptomyces sp. NPDC005885]|uniref:hypothetical protein n=1 Tax=Streptomyces sp. NPDC005885 TaxID=3157079 RepID=UPI0033D307AA
IDGMPEDDDLNYPLLNLLSRGHAPRARRAGPTGRKTPSRYAAPTSLLRKEVDAASLRDADGIRSANS